MPHLNWEPDPIFVNLANMFPLQPLQEAEQYPGDNVVVGDYAHLTNEAIDFIDFSPVSIIQSAQEGQWLTFLLKVGLWGKMIPGPHRRPFLNIYSNSYPNQVTQDRLQHISAILGATFNSLHLEVEFENIWNQFNMLNWSHVIRSKVLHFQARAAGIICHSPIPIDGLMSNRWLWRQFKQVVEQHPNFNWPRPAGIAYYDYASYKRYFTAMCTWAVQLDISVVDMEMRLFQHFIDNRNNPNNLFI